jgi:hypothetical protein
MSPKKTSAPQLAAPTEPPRETFPIACGPMEDHADAMILNSHVDAEGRPMRFEVQDGALVRTDIADRRSPDQDVAVENAFVEGALPEDDRRRSAPPTDPEE